MREVNVLITAASRRVPLIQSFTRALENLNLKGNVVTTDINTLSPGLYFSDRHYLVPLTTDKKYIPIIKSICFKERIHLLVPTIDDELPLFGAHADAFLASGVRVVVSSAKCGTVCNDKHLTSKFLLEHGIPAAKTWLPSELDFSAIQYPLFLKPRSGRGSVGVHPVFSERELRFFLEYEPDPVVQEHLTGREFTIDVLADFGGRIISVVPRERLVIRSGVTDRGKTWNNPKLIDIGVRAAESLGVRGPANIQVMYKDDQATVFEVNPRFSGGIPLTIAAGADFPAWLIEMRCGRRVKPCIGKFTDGLLMACYESAVFLSAEAAAASVLDVHPAPEPDTAGQPLRKRAVEGR
jgi:carbamoyl-phosphate synthase large subunit